MRILHFFAIAASSVAVCGFQSTQLNIRPSSTKLVKLSTSAKLELIRKAGVKLQSTTPRASFWLSPLNPKSASPRGFLSYFGTFEPDPVYNGVVKVNDRPQNYQIKIMRPPDVPAGVPVTYMVTLHVDNGATSIVGASTGETAEWQSYFFYETGLQQHTVVITSAQPAILVRQETKARHWFSFYGADIEIYR